MQLNANWYELMTGDVMVERAMETAQTRTEFQINFAIWKDMMDEPEKYGDDIYEWLALHETLMRGPGRWRLAAYEYAIEAKAEAAVLEEQAEWRAAFTPIAKQAASKCMDRWVKRDVAAFIAKLRNAVVTIQSAIRGHQVRSALPIRDCCMCLSHRISPLQTDVGMMCRGCAAQGPYDEETGPIADPWSEFRADYVDMVPTPVKPAEPVHMCAYCETLLPLDQEVCDDVCRQYLAEDGPHTAHHEPCRWCFGELDEGQANGFCDSDCWTNYMKELCRDST